ncbi:MAG: hypothetical protein WED15_00880 [Akkermansiaceae bacterium]
MDTHPLAPSRLAQKINETDFKLQKLEQELEEIGQPAAQDLLPRLEALKIEENALKRNFGEALDMPDPNPVKLEKIDTLLRHIEREESSMQHDAEYLNQAALSSVTLALPAGAHVVELFRQGAERFAESPGKEEHKTAD